MNGYDMCALDATGINSTWREASHGDHGTKSAGFNELGNITSKYLVASTAWPT